ncbi:MAG: DNA recombination protein RmuC [Candidatus Binatus sp.]|uniref:DNA recombination protein RmuC n=1 Tax=Candidatus Binatus sp. TaxID=2811406 RepID=UPI0027228580|nr:DNA recombination protein RmuC [Candidatus Binatus sp.]MDO8432716.1 DNA recombination protein RmuC [Candidatus Binatus sp.]
MEWIAALIAGVAIGALIGWLFARANAAGAIATAVQERAQREELAKALTELRDKLAIAQSEKVTADTELKNAKERIEQERALLDDAEKRLTDTFKSLAADALRTTSDDFIKRADEKFRAERETAGKDFEARQKSIDELVKPARESLTKLDGELRRIEKDRSESQGNIKSQLESLGAQTGRLVDALKTPVVRGRWGEVQLRNVAEIAGMTDHCDFFEQESVTTDDGRLRPDMVVRLPGGKIVVVDSKVPLKAYLEALEVADDEARRVKLKEHAAQIRKHVDQLSSKSYQEALKPTPEFVVLFLPGEMFFSAALQQDPALIEDAALKKVVLASPTTLIAVLKAVAYGWRQEQLAENAQRIAELGKDLYERVSTMAEHIEDIGGDLNKAVGSYNKAVGSLERMVLPAARRFKELGVGGNKDIPELNPVDNVPRQLTLTALPETERHDD